MEKKLIKELNIKINSNQKKIRGSIFLPNTNLKKNNQRNKYKNKFKSKKD